MNEIFLDEKKTDLTVPTRMAKTTWGLTFRMLECETAFQSLYIWCFTD